MSATMNASAMAPAETLLEHFSYERRDPRTADWFLMSSGMTVFAISSIYLAFAVKILPAIMAERKPIKPTLLINAYNLFQVVGNVWLTYNYLINGWGTTYSYVCEPVDTDPTPGSAGYQMAVTFHVAYLFRYVDFTDTIFFHLSKKTGHVSILQITHHFLMPMYGWMLMAWVPGGQSTFGGFFNAIVHSIMYSYYFVAAMGPQYQKYLWWKRYLTSLQIVQFVAVLAREMGIYYGYSSCDYPWQVSLVTIWLMLCFLVLFGNFYRQEYITKKNKKNKAN